MLQHARVQAALAVPLVALALGGCLEPEAARLTSEQSCDRVTVPFLAVGARATYSGAGRALPISSPDWSPGRAFMGQQVERGFSAFDLMEGERIDVEVLEPEGMHAGPYRYSALVPIRYALLSSNDSRLEMGTEWMDGSVVVARRLANWDVGAGAPLHIHHLTLDGLPGAWGSSVLWGKDLTLGDSDSGTYRTEITAPGWPDEHRQWRWDVVELQSDVARGACIATVRFTVDRGPTFGGTISHLVTVASGTGWPVVVRNDAVPAGAGAWVELDFSNGHTNEVPLAPSGKTPVRVAPPSDGFLAAHEWGPWTPLPSAVSAAAEHPETIVWRSLHDGAKLISASRALADPDTSFYDAWTLLYQHAQASWRVKVFSLDPPGSDGQQRFHVEGRAESGGTDELVREPWPRFEDVTDAFVLLKGMFPEHGTCSVETKACDLGMHGQTGFPKQAPGAVAGQGFRGLIVDLERGWVVGEQSRGPPRP